MDRLHRTCTDQYIGIDLYIWVIGASFFFITKKIR